MKWTFTRLIIANLVFIILSGFFFTLGFPWMGGAFGVCAGLVFSATFLAYLGGHIPADRG